MNYLNTVRSKLLIKITHQIAVPLLMFGRKKVEFKYTQDELEKFPEDTLGSDLAKYLKKMNFSLLKNYERHDCKHILFRYEMDEDGEAGLQFYFLGNGIYTIPVVTSIFAYCLIMPDKWSKYYCEFKKGKQRKAIGKLEIDQYNFNELVNLKTIDIQKQFKI